MHEFFIFFVYYKSSESNTDEYCNVKIVNRGWLKFPEVCMPSGSQNIFIPIVGSIPATAGSPKTAKISFEFWSFCIGMKVSVMLRTPSNKSIL